MGAARRGRRGVSRADVRLGNTRVRRVHRFASSHKTLVKRRGAREVNFTLRGVVRPKGARTPP